MTTPAQVHHAPQRIGVRVPSRSHSPQTALSPSVRGLKPSTRAGCFHGVVCFKRHPELPLSSERSVVLLTLASFGR